MVQFALSREMCCGKETYEEVKEGRVGLTRRKVLRAMGVGTGLVALGGLTGCTQWLGLDRDLTKQGVNGAVNTAGSSNGLVFGDQQAALLVGDEEITARAVSWQDRMQGLDLIYKSDQGGVNSRIYVGGGTVYVYYRSEEDLLTLHSKINRGRLKQLGEALEALDVQPADYFGLINPKTREEVEKRLLQKLRKVKSEHAQGFKGHNMDIAWNGQKISVAPFVYSNEEDVAKRVKDLLKGTSGRAIWKRGQRIPELIGTNQEFFEEMVSLYPATVSSQSSHEGFCSACGTGAGFTVQRGWWIAACFVPGGQLLCVQGVTLTAVSAAVTGWSCYRCSRGGQQQPPEPPPPPPPPPPPCNPSFDDCPAP